MRSIGGQSAYGHRMDSEEAHVEVRGEGVEDLVGAHVRVGVDDTLTAALYSGGCEGHVGAMASARAECALALRSVLAGWTLGEILEVPLRSTELTETPFQAPPSGSALLACWLSRGDPMSPAI